MTQPDLVAGHKQLENERQRPTNKAHKGHAMQRPARPGVVNDTLSLTQVTSSIRGRGHAWTLSAGQTRHTQAATSKPGATQAAEGHTIPINGYHWEGMR